MCGGCPRVRPDRAVDRRTRSCACPEVLAGGESEGEDRSPLAPIRRLDRAAVGLHDLLRDGQAEAVAAASRRARAVEALEEVREVGVADPSPRIRDLEKCLSVGYTRTDRDAAPCGYVLQRVRHQRSDGLA